MIILCKWWTSSCSLFFFYVFNFNFALTVSTCHDCRRLLFLASFFSSSFSLMKIVCKHLLWFSPMLLCVRLGAMKIAFLSLIPSSDICRGRKLFSSIFLFSLFFALRAILSIVQRHTSEKYHRCRFTQAQCAMHNRELSVLRSSQLQEEMNFKILNFSLSKGWKTFDEGRKNRQTETSCWQIFRFFSGDTRANIKASLWTRAQIT